MMEKCKCLKKGDVPFVCSVQAAPQPLCVLATDTQLKQLQMCCTVPYNFSVLFIDPNFNLGTFFVTPMVFLHKVVVTKHTKKPPLFLGPMLIHQRMNTDAYSYLCIKFKSFFQPFDMYKQPAQMENLHLLQLLKMLFLGLFTFAASSIFVTTVKQK